MFWPETHLNLAHAPPLHDHPRGGGGGLHVYQYTGHFGGTVVVASVGTDSAEACEVGVRVEGCSPCGTPVWLGLLWARCWSQQAVAGADGADGTSGGEVDGGEGDEAGA